MNKSFRLPKREIFFFLSFLCFKNLGTHLSALSKGSQKSQFAVNHSFFPQEGSLDIARVRRIKRAHLQKLGVKLEVEIVITTALDVSQEKSKSC